MWNASDLRRTKRDHFDGKTKIYEEVLSKCINRMYTASLKGKSNYIFKVPIFLVGLPLYNYDTCLVYLIKALREKDYYVRFHTPSWLYISWDENPEEDPMILLQDETNRTNTLMNEKNNSNIQITTPLKVMNPILPQILDNRQVVDKESDINNRSIPLLQSSLSKPNSNEDNKINSTNSINSQFMSTKTPPLIRSNNKNNSILSQINALR